MSKVVESTVSIKNVDKNILRDAVNLLTEHEKAVMSSSETYSVWGKTYKTKGILVFIPNLGYADIYIKNGVIHVNADEMYRERILNIIKQKYTAAYIMRKLKAKMSYNKVTGEIKMEVLV